MILLQKNANILKLFSLPLFFLPCAAQAAVDLQLALQANRTSASPGSQILYIIRIRRVTSAVIW